MMLSSRVRRVLSIGACAGLMLAVQGSVGGPATADPIANGDFTYTVTGGPFDLKGNGGVDCSQPKNANMPAHLNGVLTVTTTHLPPGTANLFLETVIAGSFDVEHVTPATVLTLPADGGQTIFGNPSPYTFECVDGSSGDLTFVLSAYDSGFGYLDSVTDFTTVPLTIVD